MPQMRPHQVLELVDLIFPWAANLEGNFNIYWGQSGDVKVIVDAVEQIPNELITLNGQDLLAFTASLSTLKRGLERWSTDGGTYSIKAYTSGFGDVHPMLLLRSLLHKCKDNFVTKEAKQSSGTQNLFIEELYPEEIPIVIRDSLNKFKVDYPDPNKVAFIMMKFGNTKPHKEIIEGIKKSLDLVGVTAVRADEKEYHDDLFDNVLTYIYGCGFGIAVFERIEAEEFNPNVALEVGYMFALRKPVCLLKDKTLKTLHTDLVGKLYRVFDCLDATDTIPEQLSRWLKDKGL